ncbi:hypothetical protein EDC04DRAFT_2597431 [Pisolithus marmoratus]|nr:hypothetical protein EDC04DRAFT_2597431 [Pisolithus marmoratus]
MNVVPWAKGIPVRTNEVSGLRVTEHDASWRRYHTRWQMKPNGRLQPCWSVCDAVRGWRASNAMPDDANWTYEPYVASLKLIQKCPASSLRVTPGAIAMLLPWSERTPPSAGRTQSFIFQGGLRVVFRRERTIMIKDREEKKDVTPPKSHKSKHRDTLLSARLTRDRFCRPKQRMPYGLAELKLFAHVWMKFNHRMYPVLEDLSDDFQQPYRNLDTSVPIKLSVQARKVPALLKFAAETKALKSTALGVNVGGNEPLLDRFRASVFRKVFAKLKEVVWIVFHNKPFTYIPQTIQASNDHTRIHCGPTHSNAKPSDKGVPGATNTLAFGRHPRSTRKELKFIAGNDSRPSTLAGNPPQCNPSVFPELSGFLTQLINEPTENDSGASAFTVKHDNGNEPVPSGMEMLARALAESDKYGGGGQPCRFACGCPTVVAEEEKTKAVTYTGCHELDGPHMDSIDYKCNARLCRSPEKLIVDSKV